MMLVLNPELKSVLAKQAKSPILQLMINAKRLLSLLLLMALNMLSLAFVNFAKNIISTFPHLCVLLRALIEEPFALNTKDGKQDFLVRNLKKSSLAKFLLRNEAIEQNLRKKF